MVKNPSDIHSKKTHKLTRRRVVRMLTAAGVAPAAASRITVDDVKAADDDQVPISLDVDGKIKENVPANWYDRIVHTRNVTDKIQESYGHRKSVIGIGYSAGERGGDNPYVVVGINQDSNSKEKIKRRSRMSGKESGSKNKNTKLPLRMTVRIQTNTQTCAIIMIATHLPKALTFLLAQSLTSHLEVGYHTQAKPSGRMMFST